ncbi:MAG: hypothetical protein LQ351_003187 [Letrouitia transgressa]|nr:MAG: hypothetical protein LQ351_003187 [Letrouitia transgressa]
MNDPAIVPTAAQADEGLLPVSTPPPKSPLWPSPSKKTIVGLARHTLGIVLLLITVFLWTTSSFLASTIFADNTYSKPFLVTYSNSLFFAILLLGPLATIAWNDIRSLFRTLIGRGQRAKYETIADDDNQDLSTPEDRSSRSPGAPLQQQQDDLTSTPDAKGASNADKMTFRETAKLGFEFSFLWFAANYFTAACLEYTTVASSTILTSTSSIWTLIFGAIIHVEFFSLRKLIGVIASLAGVVLISRADISGENDKSRGSFPHKTSEQIAIGDVLALLSAIIYGIYTTMMKKNIRDETRVNMIWFFGFVGLFNITLLLPGFPIFHYTGLETFEFPPTKRVLTIVLVNSAISLFSDFCWAYSIMLTSPLVTTVGLSLTIPLSLIGQMVLNGQTSSVTYWIGAVIVVASFLLINHESKAEEKTAHELEDSRSS